MLGPDQSGRPTYLDILCRRRSQGRLHSQGEEVNAQNQEVNAQRQLTELNVPRASLCEGGRSEGSSSPEGRSGKHEGSEEESTPTPSVIVRPRSIPVKPRVKISPLSSLSNPRSRSPSTLGSIEEKKELDSVEEKEEQEWTNVTEKR